MPTPMPSPAPTPSKMPRLYEAFLGHARGCVTLAEEADASLAGPDQAAVLHELDMDHECLLAALRWLRAQRGGGGLGSRLTLALCLFWEVRGYWTEARQWLRAMVTVADGEEGFDEALLARMLNEAGIFARMQSDWESASLLFQRALAIHSRRADLKGQGIALNGLGTVALLRGEQGAKGFFEKAIAINYERGDLGNVAKGMGNLAVVYFNDRDYAAAEKLQNQSLDIQREIGNQHWIADALSNLGNTHILQGNYQEAKRCHQESLDLKLALGYQPGLSDSYINLATLSKNLGEYSAAYHYLREALTINKNTGDMKGFACVFEGLADVASSQGLDEWFILWYAVSTALRKKHRILLPAADAEESKSYIAGIRASLGEQAFQRAWRRGRAMSLPRAIALALKGDDEAADTGGQ